MIGDAISRRSTGGHFSTGWGHLAAGWDYHAVGQEVLQLVRLTPKTATVTDKARREVIALDDPFGSLITDIRRRVQDLGYKVGDRSRSCE